MGDFEPVKRDAKSEYKYRLVLDFFRITDNLREVRQMSLLKKKNKMLKFDVISSVINFYNILRPKIKKFIKLNAKDSEFYEKFIDSMDYFRKHMIAFDLGKADDAFQQMNEFCEESGIMSFDDIEQNRMLESKLNR